jgi:lipid A 3-O-deacylase
MFDGWVSLLSAQQQLRRAPLSCPSQRPSPNQYFRQTACGRPASARVSGPATESFSLEAGAAKGIAAFGAKQAHDLALMSLVYGRMVGHVKAEDHWYRGNWEFRAELFGGAEFSPDTEWLLGITPHLRYDFATGSRFIPFIDAGAGVTVTGIGPPDLSNTFEFNLQGTVGTHWFINDNVALTLEARFLHLSCAHISSPNLGLNAVVGMVGLTWFF